MNADSGSAPEATGSLPVALTSLVGRERELRHLTALLRGTRLLTLTGTGGSGKTRLGLAFASAIQADFRHGAWWVDLASLTGSELIAGTTAAALGIAQTPGQDTTATVVRHLRSRAVLLVFDNCEHVVTGCAEFVERLLSSCPDVTMVATSREVLGVPGERVFRVDGLRLPSGPEDPSEAVELFTECARAISPDFSVGPGDLDALTRLCRRLDGLPLAIEVAAARAGVLGVAEIERRLGRDAPALRNPSRTAPPRHQTLEAALDWSHRLLTDKERVLFRRLSCFSGSFSLAAAEAVTIGDGIEADDVAGIVAALASKSLVLVAQQGSECRYRMLETIRQYSERKLADSGEVAAVRSAHTAHYLWLADHAHLGLVGADQARWLDRFELEHDNLRAVLRRTVPGEPQAGARLAAQMWPFWYRRGYYHEARAWLERAAEAALGELVAAPVLAGVLMGAGVLAFLQCDYVTAAERLTKARVVYEEESDQVGLATALQRLGSIAREEGRYADARKLHEESLAIWSAIGDDPGVATSQNYLGFVAWLSGDPERAIVLCGKAAAAFRAAGLRQETAAAMVNQGVAARLSGDPERAAALLQAGLDISIQTGYQEGIAWASHELAVIIADDDPATAADMLGESLEIQATLGDRWRVASVVETIAEVVLPSADAVLKATILGASAALRESLGTPVPPADRPAYDQCMHALRERLGPRGFRGAWQRGQLMGPDELVDLALQATGAAQSQPDQPDQPDPGEHGLTERELDVLRLLSQGLTNREIGRQLGISTGTAGVHVSNILRKLGVSGRVQAVTVAHRIGLGA